MVFAAKNNLMNRELSFSDNDGIHIVLSESAMERIYGLCKKAGKNETGGILIGMYSGEGFKVNVTTATAPPLDSKCSKFAFLRGTNGLKELLDDYWEQGEYYVGEWHYHPYASAQPSKYDIEQMKELADSRGLKCPEPILAIVGGSMLNGWTYSIQIITRNGVKLFHINNEIEKEKCIPQ